MSRLFIGGDSAGAQIASQTAAVITNDKLANSMGIQPSVDKKQLKGALLYCGLYNMDRMTQPQSSFILRLGVKSVFWSYTGVKDFATFSRLDEMSTVHHVTPDYPPVFSYCGRRRSIGAAFCGSDRRSHSERCRSGHCII